MMELNDRLYSQMLTADKPVLVVYHAPRCVYCRRIEPVLQRLAAHREDVIVGQVNIDDFPDLARQEQIEVVPTLVLYHRGEALGSMVIPESRSRIDEFLEDFLGS